MRTEVPFSRLVPTEAQARRHYTLLDELAESIDRNGLLQNIVGKIKPDGMIEVVAGERRRRAIALLMLPLDQQIKEYGRPLGNWVGGGCEKSGCSNGGVPVFLLPATADEAAHLIENIQREDLNPMEEARALDRLIREFQVTHQEAADAVGRSRAAVSNLLRLLDLAPEVAEWVDRRELEMGHARALLGLSEQRQQVEVARLVCKKSLSVRETEALVRRLTNVTGGEGAETGRTGGGGRSGRDPNVTALESRLAETLGAKVVIDHSGKTGKGRVVVAYNSLDELDGILQHIH